MADLYSPLPPRSIRLLEVCDDTGLLYYLSTFELHNAPPFVALSYTWGKAKSQEGRPANEQYVVTINDHKVAIQQNLYDAMTTLASEVRHESQEASWIWIDFICINQSDVQERNVQVALMKSIYESSSAVFAWLGLPLDKEKIESAISLMRSFNEHLRAGLELHDDIDTVVAGIDSQTPGFPSVKGSNEWRAWEGIAEMMDSSYWTRTWIYQEATTPGLVCFYCGKHKFYDVHLQATSTFGTQFSYKCPEFDPLFSEAIGLASNPTRLVAARLQREDDLSRGLLELVVEVRLTDCSDERDKIYAPLGQASKREADLIQVDYNKPLKTVFGDLVRAVIDGPSRFGLRFLEHVHIPAPGSGNEVLREILDPDWPSWIPDWRQWVSLLPFYPGSDHQRPLTDPYPGSSIQVEIHGYTMSIEGALLGEVSISHLTSICEDPRNVEEVKNWYTNLTRADRTDKTSESIRRCIVADAHTARNDADDQRYLKRDYMVDWDSLDEDMDLTTRISNVCLGRRMGRTSDGYFGIFPAAAQINDVVSVFGGGKLLYLLREVAGRAGHFRFIGACYVHGLMDGEAMRTERHITMLHLI